MINIGTYNKLKILRQTDFGYFLEGGGDNSSEDVLLPNNSTNGEDLSIGEEVDAFIYRDSKDRPIATLRKPLAKVGDLAYLKVVATTNIGSFIDFGLDKDILVPQKEKLYPLEKNNSYLFYIYLDKTGRIAATTNIDKHLIINDKYKQGESVKATVYGFQTNKSAMVAVDNKYKAVILHNEYFNELSYGEVIDVTINKFYEDGRLGVTPRKSTRTEVEELQDCILQFLKEHNNSMTYNDKTSPEEIYKIFRVSKNHFKQALGGLMKKGLISQHENGTILK